MSEGVAHPTHLVGPIALPGPNDAGDPTHLLSRTCASLSPEPGLYLCPHLHQSRLVWLNGESRVYFAQGLG